MKTIVIVGAGFTGTITAVQLLRQAPASTKVILVDDESKFGRGVAYAVANTDLMLNVPAGNMSAFPDDPDSFNRFLANRSVINISSSFQPRATYGDYLLDLLSQADKAHPGRLKRIYSQVRSIELKAGRSVAVTSGGVLDFDKLIIATGNEASCGPRGLWTGSADWRYISDPWQPGILDKIPTASTVAILGTGLTAVDVTLKLLRMGKASSVKCISRRGLLPTAHRGSINKPKLHPEFPAECLRMPTLRAQVRLIREMADQSNKEGGDWRDVISSLRTATPALWQRLSASDRARFVRHLSPFWDCHRHRLAPSVNEEFHQALSNETVSVESARVQMVEGYNNGLRLTVQPRGLTPSYRCNVDFLINCTGPNYDVAQSQNPLLSALFRSGLLSPDRLKLGLKQTSEYEHGRGFVSVTDDIYYVGPLLRAVHWEATAVPELREHIVELVKTL